MSYSNIRKAIQGHIVTNLSTGVVPIDKRAWDNVDFTIPSDGSSWIRISVQNNISNHKSCGPNKLTRREGIVFIQVFVVKDSETDEANTIIDALVAIFETKLLAGVTFKSPNVREVGLSEGWYQINISVPFWADDITTFS